MITPGRRVSSPLISVVAAATTTAVYTLTGTQLGIIRKIMWFTNQAGNPTLQVGYTTLAAVWTPVMPDIYMLTGIDGELDEANLPVAGNTIQGFQIDATLVTGFAGIIAVRASAAGAAPNDVRVRVEIEIFGS